MILNCLFALRISTFSNVSKTLKGFSGCPLDNQVLLFGCPINKFACPKERSKTTMNDQRNTIVGEMYSFGL